MKIIKTFRKVIKNCMKIIKNYMKRFRNCFVCVMLYVPVNNIPVMLECFPIFLDLSSTKQRIKRLAQGHNAVPPLSLNQKMYEIMKNCMKIIKKMYENNQKLYENNQKMYENNQKEIGLNWSLDYNNYATAV